MFFSAIDSRFPFDCKNLVGYLFAVLFEYLFTVYEFVYVGSFATYGLGFFLFFFTSYRDMVRNLESINKHAKSKKKHPKIVKQLVTFFHLYSNVKELSMHWNRFFIVFGIIGDCFFSPPSRFVRAFSRIYQPIFMVLFTSSLILICTCMLILQEQLV